MQRIWSLCLFVLLVAFPLQAFGEEAWEVLPGPVVKVEAIIRPYVNVSVALSDEKGNAFCGQEPKVTFDCDRGPGVYRAKNPLLLSVVTNTPLQVLCEATPLQGQEKEMVLPPERLSFALTERGKDPEKFTSFSQGKKLLLFETSQGGVTYEALCHFQLHVTSKDRAGQYGGTIVVEVLYRP